MKLEHYRICGYVFTISMHVGNTVLAKLTKHDPAVLEDPDIKTMLEMENTYFTLWNIFFQMVYATFSLYCDVGSLYLKNNKKWAVYMNYRKRFFCALLWPATCFVFTAFWTLFTYDRSIIFPEFVDKFIPLYGNIIIHGAVLPVVIWETAFLPIEKPKSHKYNFALTSSLYAVYIPWIFYVNSVKKLWPYPILTMLDGTVYLPLFLSAAYALLVLHYFLHWRVREFIWGKESIKSS